MNFHVVLFWVITPWCPVCGCECFRGILLPTYQTIWSHNEDHHDMNLHYCGNLKSSIFINLFSALFFSPSILCIVIASASLTVCFRNSWTLLALKGWTQWSTHRVVKARTLWSLVSFGHVTVKLCSSQIMEWSSFRYSYPIENRSWSKNGRSELSHYCIHCIAHPPYQMSRDKTKWDLRKGGAHRRLSGIPTHRVSMRVMVGGGYLQLGVGSGPWRRLVPSHFRSITNMKVKVSICEQKNRHGDLMESNLEHTEWEWTLPWDHEAPS